MSARIAIDASGHLCGGAVYDAETWAWRRDASAPERVANGSGAMWLGPDIIAASRDAGGVLRRFVRAVYADGPRWEPVDLETPARGANTIRASGASWAAAVLAGTIEARGQRRNGAPWPADLLTFDPVWIGADESSTWLLNGQYRFLPADSAVSVPIPGAIVPESMPWPDAGRVLVQRPGGLAIWTPAGETPVPTVTPIVYFPSLSGGWVSYQTSDRRVVLHRIADASRGVAWAAEQAHGLNVRLVGDEAIVAWAIRDGQLAGDIERRIVDPSQAWQPLAPQAAPIEVRPWQSPIHHVAWKLFYEHNGGDPFSTPDDLPYTACIAETAEGVQRANERGVPVIANADIVNLAERPLAVLVYASDGAGAATVIAASRATAEARDLPLFVYIDVADLEHHLPANLPLYAVLSPQWYAAGPGEPIDALLARLRAQVEACRASGVRYVAPTIHAYERGTGWTDAALADLQGALIDLAHEWPDLVIGLAPFAFGRRGGVIDHPSMLAWHRASAAASRGIASWPKPSQFTRPPTPAPSPDPSPAPDPEPAPIPVPSALEDPMTKKPVIALRTPDARTLVVEPDGRLTQRGTDLSLWTHLTPHVIDGGKWQIGALVVLQAHDGRFVSVAPHVTQKTGKTTKIGRFSFAQPGETIVTFTPSADPDDAAVFTLGPGEFPGTWTLIHSAGLLTALLGDPEVPVVVRPAGDPLPSWQAFSAVDVATGEAYAGPF